MQIPNLTLEYIKNFMLDHYNNNCCNNPKYDELNITDWIFLVYIPKDYTFSMSRELQEIIDNWVNIREELFSSYSQLQFNDLKTMRYYEFDDSMGNYDWFIFLAICVENNFIVDAVETCNEYPYIIDIEPSTPRLKVRIG